MRRIPIIGVAGFLLALAVAVSTLYRNARRDSVIELRSIGVPHGDEVTGLLRSRQGDGPRNAVLVREASEEIRVRAIDLSGQPVAGVRLDVCTGAETRVVLTDDQGCFMLGAGPGGIVPRVGSDLYRAVCWWWGRYGEFNVVLTSLGELILEVEDDLGYPASDVAAIVRPRLTWIDDVGGDVAWITGVYPQSKMTDRGGFARFSQLPTQCLLDLELVSNGEVLRSCGQIGGEVCLDGEADQGCEGILLTPSTTSLLRATIANQVTLIGRVEREDGSRVSYPGLQIEKLGDSASSVVLLNVSGTEAGTFERAMNLTPGARLRITGSDGPILGLSPGSHEIGWTDVVVPGGKEKRVEFRVCLSPAGRISGVIRNADGSPAVGILRAVSTEDGRTVGRTGIDANGAFDVSVPAKGRYDLALTERASRFYGRYGLGTYDAGSRDLEFVLQDDRTVSVSFGAEGSDWAGSARVLVGRPVQPMERDEVGWLADPRMTIADSWPMGAPVGPDTNSLVIVDGIEMFFQLRDLHEDRTIHLQEDAYVIGVEAWDEESRPYALIATDLRYFAPGQYQMECAFSPTRKVSGTIEIPGCVPESLAISLADFGGEVMPMHLGRNATFSFSRLSVDGEFEIAYAPAKAFFLRVGLPGELRAGSFKEQFLVVPEASCPLNF